MHSLVRYAPLARIPYQLLTDTEKQVLQRLSVFRSSFDLDSASAVVACEKLPGHLVIDGVLSLCEKSLLVRDAGDGQGLRYRLLYMTRLFAERELALGSDAFEVHHRHAAFVLNSYAQHEDDGRSRSATYRKNFLRVPMYADLRSAVTWALLNENDLKLGMQIMADSACVHLAGHATYEARKNLDAAIDKLERAGAQGTALELKLRTNLTFAFAQGIVRREELDRALTMTRTLANDLGSIEEKIEALYATCTGLYGHGRYLEALSHCDEIRELAQGELANISTALGDRLAVLNLHALGQHDAAERLAHRVLQIDDKALPWRFQSAVPFAVSMRIQLARIHWLRGDFLQAWSTIHEAIKLDDGSHLQIKCQLLGMAAIPIAIWKGDVPTATRWVRELLEQATHANIPYWHVFADTYGDVLAGHTALSHEPKRHFIEENIPLMDICATLQPTAPRSVTVTRVRQGEVGWCAPEVLRVDALSKLVPQDPQSRVQCLAELHSALDLSKEQGTRFWSLRLAISIFDVSMPDSREHVFAKDFLKSLLNAIDDGSPLPDLQYARRLQITEGCQTQT